MLPCFSTDDSETVLYFQWEILKSAVDYIDKALADEDSDHPYYIINQFYKYEKKEYETAAEMFIYLTLCPKFMFDWTSLYVDLLQIASPNIAVQALNRIIITGRLKTDHTIINISKGILKKTSDKLSLKFQDIDRYFKGLPKTTHSSSNISNLSIGFNNSNMLGNFPLKNVYLTFSRFCFIRQHTSSYLSSSSSERQIRETISICLHTVL